MKKEYINRYGDHIYFNEVDEHTVEMTGYYNPHMRVAYMRDYSEAYEVYCLGKEQPMSFVDFVGTFENGEFPKEQYMQYSKFIKPDTSCVQMVDPSGGPYISLGFDIGRYLEDGKERRVKAITIEEKKVVFNV